MTVHQYTDTEKRELRDRRPAGYAVAECEICGADHLFARAATIPRTCGRDACIEARKARTA